jgi:hypothetical protein
MKLNAEQIDTIQEALNVQNLCFKEFEEEMFDHICSSIENELVDNEDVLHKTHNLIYSFNDHFEDIGSKLTPGGYYVGLRAVEL